MRMPLALRRSDTWHAIPLTARALYQELLMESASNRSDGHLTARDVHVASMDWSVEEAQFDITALKAAGLAEHDDGGGLYLPRWQEHHQSRVVIEARSQQMAELGRKGGQTTAQVLPREPGSQRFAPKPSAALGAEPSGEPSAALGSEPSRRKGKKEEGRRKVASSRAIALFRELYGGKPMSDAVAKWLTRLSADHGEDALLAVMRSTDPAGNGYLKRVQTDLENRAEADADAERHRRERERIQAMPGHAAHVAAYRNGVED